MVTSTSMPRILLQPFGSYGDIHPYIALALGLRERGHKPTIATTAIYKEKIEAEGIAFRPVRPDVGKPTPELMRKIFDRRRGGEFIFREILLPNLRATFQDLLPLIAETDLLVTHTIGFAAVLLARQRHLPWVSTVLSPAMLRSVSDPTVWGALPFAERIARAGPRLNRGLFWLFDRITERWLKPYRDLERELGLAPGPNPIFEGQHSPDLVLALFSPLLAPPQPDWPPQTLATGFLFYDRDLGHSGLSPELERFLNAGTPPIVFTLGSAAVQDPGAFFVASAEAARRLGRRAVLLVGKETPPLPPGVLDEGIAAFDYAPFSQLFPRAAAIVHQGGIGTTGQGMRSGRPTLVMPLSHDQYDNAARVARLGISRTIARERYSPATATGELKALLDDSACAARAADLAKRMKAEDGVCAACDAVERYLSARPIAISTALNRGGP